jgi:hypothetical protein
VEEHGFSHAVSAKCRGFTPEVDFRARFAVELAVFP